MTGNGAAAAAAAVTDGVAATGNDQAQAQAGMSKEELALEDRRRRNRETQRAIRKRKAQKLQDSEVKIVLHEQELERVRNLLEESQHENASLRKQLANCRCGGSTTRSGRRGSATSDAATRTRSPSPEQPAAIPMMSHAKKRKSPTEALASVFSSRPPVPSTSTSLRSLSPAAKTQKVSHVGPSTTYSYPQSQPRVSQATLNHTVTSLASLPLRDLTPSGVSPPTAELAHGHLPEHHHQLPAFVRAPISHLSPQSHYAQPPPLSTQSHYLPPVPLIPRRYRDTLVEDGRQSPCPPGCQCPASSVMREYEASTSGIDSISTSDGSRDDYLPNRIHRLSSHRSTDSSNSGLTLPPLLPHGHGFDHMPITRNGKGKSVSQPTTQDEIDEMRLPLPVPTYSKVSRGDDAFSSSGHSTRASSVAYQESDVRLGSSPPTTIPTKRSIQSSINEDPLVESPAEQSESGQGTDDTIMADGTAQDGAAKGYFPSPSGEKVECCNGFIECNEETDQAFSKDIGQRSTLDDFRALFGDKAVADDSALAAEK